MSENCLVWWGTPFQQTRESFGINPMRRRIRESYANVRPLKHDFARLRASFAGGYCQCFELPIEFARLGLQSRVFGSKTLDVEQMYAAMSIMKDSILSISILMVHITPRHLPKPLHLLYSYCSPQIYTLCPVC